MDKADHEDTASWGSSRVAEEYRKQQAKLIKEGKYMEVLQVDIDDLKSIKFQDGTSMYDKHKDTIKEAIEYARCVQKN